MVFFKALDRKSDSELYLSKSQLVIVEKKRNGFVFYIFRFKNMSKNKYKIKIKNKNTSISFYNEKHKSLVYNLSK